MAGKIRSLSNSATTSPRPPASRGFDLIAFPIIDWTFRFQRPQQLLSRFAADGHRVFYLRTAFLGLDRDPRVSSLSKGVYDVGIPGEADLDLYSGRLEGETLRQAEDALLRVATEEGIGDAVLFVQYPVWEPLARRLQERRGWRLVYDCLDEHSGFGTHGASTAEDERRLIHEADLVLATSGRLHERIRTLRADAMRLPNAGDAERFAALPPRASSPLAALPRPVVGYYGAISSWFDAEAVAIAAARHAAWTFALVGDTRGLAPEALATLEARPNVRLHGEVPYAELPRWVAGFDVCTIPFRKTPLTEATNPVKLYEYLATGKPIVARRLPELEPFADAVVLYDRAEELGPALERALAEAGDDAPRRRQELARANTWETRYAALRERLAAVPRPKATAPQEVREAAVGNAVAARVKEIRRLDTVVRERDEGIAFLRTELAARERLIAAREREIAALRAESEARDGHLQSVLGELRRLEGSRLGRLRKRVERARHRVGRATAPGTPLFAVGSRLLPRRTQQWIRRRFAPVPPTTGLVEAAPRAEGGGRRRASDALPDTPAGRYDVVVFSIIDWDFRFQRPQQLATQFGRHGHRVLYLSTTQWLSPNGPAWDLARKADRVAELRIRSRRALNIYSGKLDDADLDALTAAFEELARDLAVGDAVCLVEIPYWAPLAERLRERLGWRVAYDCMDEWTNFPGFGAGVLALEEPLVRNAD
ncbi:MAG TPA: glycosyltransferase, partial [Thermoanaerobaculia bacterium]|nr:glycosyltransferase [Thermoanaerobaculia bacterium]